jgi:hypothetical protein
VLIDYINNNLITSSFKLTCIQSQTNQMIEPKKLEHNKKELKE